MLRKEDAEWIEKNRALHARKPKKVMTNRERQRYFRIRQRIKETLNGLTSMLKNMPEQQLEQAFDKDNMTDFLHELLSLESEDPEKRCKRVKRLWSWLLTEYSTYTYAVDLVGKDVVQLFVGQIPQTFQAIYYATRFME